jgi:phosphatidylserine/phosphatidylglycerophosphate/cardiolipin synthase-like enzyme
MQRDPLDNAALAEPEDGPEWLLDFALGPRDGIPQLIIQQIDGASCTLRVLAFWFTYLPIADAIVRARARGVDVRVLLDARSTTHKLEGACAPHILETRAGCAHLAARRNVAQYLKLQGVPVHIVRPSARPGSVRSAPPIFHHKAIVVDGVTACFGSSNWYLRALQKHDEHYLCVHSRRVAAGFERFAARRQIAGWPDPHARSNGSGCELCAGQLQCNSTGAHHTADAHPQVLDFRLLAGPFFGPESALDEVWLKYIRAARSRVRVVHWRLDWAPLVEELRLASRLGVNVSIFTETQVKSTAAGDSPISTHVFAPRRTAADGQLHTILFHHKVILVDENIVLLGSVNAFRKSLREDSEDLTVFRSVHVAARLDALCERHGQFRPGGV